MPTIHYEPNDEHEPYYDVKLNRKSEAPFRDFLAEFGITQTQLSRRFGIPLRTIQDWTGDRRHCPIYVRKMMATILRGDATIPGD